MYKITVDCVPGLLLFWLTPCDPLFQSMAMTGGAVVAGLVAAGSIIFSGVDYANDGRIAAVGFVIGLGILFLAYRFFRHGSERIEGEFKEKKSMGQALKQVTDLAQMAGGLR